MTDDLRARITREMAWMRTRAARVVDRLWFPWILCAVLPSLALVVLAPISAALPLWTALPGVAFLAMAGLTRVSSPRIRHAANVGALVFLAPGVLIAHVAGRGEARSNDPLAAALGGSLANAALDPLGDAAPWTGAAILDLHTGEVHADSAHQRLRAAAGAEEALRRVAHLRDEGRWLATDGHGTVALFTEAGAALVHRRLRTPEDAP